MLLYKFKEGFYLPSLFVPCSNDIGIFIQDVCYKAYLLPVFIHISFNNPVWMLGKLVFFVDEQTRFITVDGYRASFWPGSNFFMRNNLAPDIQVGPAYK